ncbi:hypothetical protein C0Q44_22695 [Paenibacillus sp. PCH8]|uniref:hypothetical protein n=1 Tax=Paenibacillus sp. PCH8 TaxID=2066524 RepID=UPI000CF88481|nr:hypothetical protein [Paenibacillus sp. PCH8]PQP81230.1 hypothetical protein C0Q44_22695 [Paenibacillus sp. PCH8]
MQIQNSVQDFLAFQATHENMCSKLYSRQNGLNARRTVDLNEFDGTVAELRAKYPKKRVPVKEDKPVTQERDINLPSKWAEATWKEVTEKGFFDGTRQARPILVRKWVLSSVGR